MNRNTIRALLADARYQVFDNVVFRILLGIAALMIVMSFCVAFQDDRISFFFGLWEVPYTTFGQMVLSKTDPKGAAIQVVQSTLVEFFAGMIGILLAIAATAFFTPRMLEKGGADNLFSKPVGRFTLLMSRYFAGVLFVAVLSILMVFGVQAGLSIMSGYNDWGFLWSAMTLIYVYAALQAFSVLVATVTRSSVAAILLTMMLFMFTGCANTGWLLMEYVAYEATVRGEIDGDEVAAEEVEEAAEDAIFGVFHGTLTVIRSTLPRTGDADMIARKLRRQIEGRPADLSLEQDGTAVFTLTSNTGGLEFQGGGVAELDGEGLSWTLEDGGRFTLTRRPRETTTSRTGRERRMTAGKLEEAREAEVVEQYGEDAVFPDTWTPKGRRVDWRVPDDAELPIRSAVYMTTGDYQFELLAFLPAGSLAAEREYGESDGTYVIETGPGGRAEVDVEASDTDPLQEFLSGAYFGVDPDALNPEGWYEKRFTWTAPWHYNIFVSIGTTLAFALVMLLLARWRLVRTDF